MSTRPPTGMIYARIDPALRERVKAEANARFEGNESVVVRDAVRLYLRLRESLGHQFEATLDELAPLDHGNEQNGAAA